MFVTDNSIWLDVMLAVPSMHTFGIRVRDWHKKHACSLLKQKSF